MMKLERVINEEQKEEYLSKKLYLIYRQENIYIVWARTLDVRIEKRESSRTQTGTI